jgi:hypothetical protein
MSLVSGFGNVVSEPPRKIASSKLTNTSFETDAVTANAAFLHYG